MFKTCFTSIAQAVFEHAQNHETRHKLAIADNENSFSYAELKIEILDIARQLRDLGVHSKRVMLEATPHAYVPAFYLALQLLDCTVIPFAKRAHNDTLNHFKNMSDADFYIASEKLSFDLAGKLFSDFSTQSTPSDTKFTNYSFPDENKVTDIFFTSGTTGRSKAVPLTSLQIIGGACNTINGGQKKISDVQLVTPPMYHAQAWQTIRGLLLLGASAIIGSGYTSSDDIINNLKNYKCNAINIVPSALKLMLNDLGDTFISLMSNLDYIEVGTAPLDDNYKLKLLTLLPNTRLSINYGATECARTVYSNLTSTADNLKSLGKVVPGVEAAIFDDNWTDIKDTHKVGRLAFKGTMVMNGYLKNPSASAEVLHDGWYISKDLAYLDHDNNLHLLGRIDDIINIGGEKLSPLEVENVLSSLPGVEQVCCIGVPDPLSVLGEIPVLFYVGNDSIDAATIKNEIRSHLDRFKRPKFIIKLDKLPVNAVSKIDRKKLREIWDKGYAQKLMYSLS